MEVCQAVSRVSATGVSMQKGRQGGEGAFRSCFVGNYHMDARKSSVKGES